MKTLLKNGTVIDGSGKPSFKGYIIFENNVIQSVCTGNPPDGFDGTVVDCVGKAIAPGFIDAHSHNDWYAAFQKPLPYFRPFVEQGITTQVTGNCGFSPFGYEPGTPHIAMINKNLFDRGDAEGDFSTFEGWRIEAAKRTPLNLVPLQGHGAIRTGISGYENRPLTPAETAKHDAKLNQSFDQGVFGLSYGLMYEPDRYATADELENAARITAKRGGILTVHERANSAASTSYSPPFGGRPHNLRAVDELITLAERTGVKLQMSHLIFVGESSWKTVDECLELVDKARSRGLDIAYDLYSMTFGTSVITVILPSWYLSLSERKKRSPITRLRLAAEIALTRKVLGFGFEDMMIAWIGKGHENLCGRFITEIAREWKVSDLDAYLRLAELSNGMGRLNMYRYYNQDIITRMIRHEPSLFMTDAWIEENGTQNAAAFSSFPKFLQFSREGKGISLEQTVRKMTGGIADRFGIEKRGYLKEGFAADITIFDPLTIKAKGDMPERPEGIDRVFINGRQVVTDGIADKTAIIGAGTILTKR